MCAAIGLAQSNQGASLTRVAEEMRAPSAFQGNRRLPLAGEVLNGPTYAIWETTLRCNQACRFCGTRAGRARPDELTTAEALQLIDQLAEIGVREVAMHGGETFLREDWLELVSAIASHDMTPSIVTGGRGVDATLAKKAQAAGLVAASVSIDGREPTHDDLRNIPGSYRGAHRAVRSFLDAGILCGCNTQINRQNMGEIPALFEDLSQYPLYGWQVQLMAPMGRAADEPDLVLEPYDLLEIMPMLARLRVLADSRGIALWPGDNVGYFGPFEHTLRDQRVPGGHSSGCGGGILAIGIEANGDIKGCSAMSSDGFIAGNIRQHRLRTLWDEAAELKFMRCFDESKLWGYCAGCYYASVCRAGCVWTSATILGRYGNCPYCHHRALEYLNAGKRERLTRTRIAPGKIRDRAEFGLEIEPAPAEWAERMLALNQPLPEPFDERVDSAVPGQDFDRSPALP
jgi:radical SAM protein with 4Fe4S-binding SPASM domain